MQQIYRFSVILQYVHELSHIPERRAAFRAAVGPGSGPLFGSAATAAAAHVRP